MIYDRDLLVRCHKALFPQKRHDADDRTLALDIVRGCGVDPDMHPTLGGKVVSQRSDDYLWGWVCASSEWIL